MRYRTLSPPQHNLMQPHAIAQRKRFRGSLLHTLHIRGRIAHDAHVVLGKFLIYY